MSDLPATLTYADVLRTLDRCMAAQPVSNTEYALSRDASLITDIVGEMIHRKLSEIPTKVLVGEHLEVMRRWHVQAAD